MLCPDPHLTTTPTTSTTDDIRDLLDLDEFSHLIARMAVRLHHTEAARSEAGHGTDASNSGAALATPAEWLAHLFTRLNAGRGFDKLKRSGKIGSLRYVVKRC